MMGLGRQVASICCATLTGYTAVIKLANEIVVPFFPTRTTLSTMWNQVFFQPPAIVSRLNGRGQGRRIATELEGPSVDSDAMQDEGKFARDGNAPAPCRDVLR